MMTKHSQLYLTLQSLMRFVLLIVAISICCSSLQVAAQLRVMRFPGEFPYAQSTTVVDGLSLDQLIVDALSPRVTTLTIQNSNISEIQFVKMTVDSVSLTITNCRITTLYFSVRTLFIGSTSIVIQDSIFTEDPAFHTDVMGRYQREPLSLSLIRFDTIFAASPNFDVSILRCSFSWRTNGIGVADGRAQQISISQANVPVTSVHTANFGSLTMTDCFFDIHETDIIVELQLDKIPAAKNILISRNTFVVYGQQFGTASNISAWQSWGVRLALPDSGGVVFELDKINIDNNNFTWSRDSGGEERAFNGMLRINGRITRASLVSMSNNYINMPVASEGIQLVQQDIVPVKLDTVLLQNVDRIVLDNNVIAMLNANGFIIGVYIRVHVILNVNTISLSNNFVRSTQHRAGHATKLRYFWLDTAKSITMNDNEAYLENVPGSIFWKSYRDHVHPFVLDEITICGELAGVCGKQWARTVGGGTDRTNGVNNVATIDISNNKVNFTTAYAGYGVYTSTTFINVQLLRVNNNEVHVNSIFPPEYSAGTHNFPSLIRISSGFRDVKMMQIEWNRGTIFYNISLNTGAIIVGAARNSWRIGAISLRFNDVYIERFSYNYTESMVSAISVLSGVYTKTTTVGSIVFSFNRVQLFSHSKCPFSMCFALGIASVELLSGVDSVVVTDNDIDMRTNGHGSAAFVLYTASTLPPFRDLILRVLKIYQASLEAVASLSISNNRIALWDVDRIVPVAVTTSGSVQIGKFYVTGNRIERPTVTSRGVPTSALEATAEGEGGNNNNNNNNNENSNSKKNTTTPSTQSWPPPQLKSSLINFECPSGGINTTVMGITVYVSVDCFAESDVHVSDLRLSDMVLTGEPSSSGFNFSQSIVTVASKLSGSLTVRNVTWVSDMYSERNKYLEHGTASKIEYSDATVFAQPFVLQRFPSPVAVHVENVTLLMRSPCTHLLPGASTTYTRRIGLGNFATLTGTLTVKNARAVIECVPLLLPGSGGGTVGGGAQPQLAPVAFMAFDGRFEAVTVIDSVFRVVSPTVKEYQYQQQQQQQQQQRVALVAIASPTSGNTNLKVLINITSVSVSTTTTAAVGAGGVGGGSVAAASADDIVTSSGTGDFVAVPALETLLTCVVWNEEVLVSRKFSAVRASIGQLQVFPCPGFEASRTESFAGSRSDTVPLTQSQNETTQTRSRSHDPVASAFGLDAATVDRLETASQIGTAVATVVANNPGALLAAARGSVMLRLAMCRMADIAARRTTSDRDEFFRNYSHQRMLRSLSFPKSLIPGFTLGAPAGASLRGAIVADVVILALFAMLTLYMGALNKNEWIRFVLGTQNDLRDSNNDNNAHPILNIAGGEGDGDGDGGDDLARQAADAASDMSILYFTPYDKMFMKIIILMMPNLAHIAGSLINVQPSGASDAALGLVPLVLIGVFVVACWVYVYRTVSEPVPGDSTTTAAVEDDDDDDDVEGEFDDHKSHRSRSNPLLLDDGRRERGSSNSKKQPSSSTPTSRRHQQQQRNDYGRYDASPRGGQLAELERPLFGGRSSSSSLAASAQDDDHPHDHHHRNASSPSSGRKREKRNSNTNNKKKKEAAVPEPEFYIEESALYFPLGASSTFQHLMHRGLQHPIARFALVGNMTWNNPYIMMRRNGQIMPGPGPLTMFGYVFNTYCGPERRLMKKARRGKPLSSSSSSGFFGHDDDNDDNSTLLAPSSLHSPHLSRGGGISRKKTATEMMISTSRSGSSSSSSTQAKKSGANPATATTTTKRSASSSSSFSSSNNKSPAAKTKQSRRHSKKKSTTGAEDDGAPRKMIYENTLRQRMSTCWIFFPILTTMICMGMSGAGDANPAACYGLFWVSLLLTVPSAILAALLHPYLVPLRNVSVIVMECGTAIGGLIFAALLAEGTEIDLSSRTISGAQLMSTLPGSVIGPGVSVFAITRVLMLRIGTSKVVTMTALREHLPLELDLAEERLLHPERFVDEEKKKTYFGFDSSWFFDD